jgi:hypothetical protein
MKKLALLSLAFLTIFTLASVTPAAAEDLQAPATLAEFEALLTGKSLAPLTPAQPQPIETVCFWIPTGDCCPTNAIRMIEENSCTGALRCGFRSC